MIRNRKQAIKKQSEATRLKDLLDSNKNLLKKIGLDSAAISAHLEPTQQLLTKLEQEVNDFESLICGKVIEPMPIEDIGTLLIKARIRSGITQQALARRLGVDETQVSRYERTLYAKSSMAIILKVIEALGVSIQVTVSERDTTS